MSEHQVYEFLAIDRSLTSEQMRELRAISTRADITSTRFWNEYHWGDLKADSLKLLVKYFDLHLYYANWGAHRLSLRLPAARVNFSALEPYFVSRNTEMRRVGSVVAFDFQDLLEDPADEYETAFSAGVFTALRTELMQGDMRLPYLAWLVAVQLEELDDDEEEPPVPPGLATLTASQQAFIDFLHLDQDLVAAAAEESKDERFDDKSVQRWVKGLSVTAKTQLLLRTLEEPDLLLGSELRRSFQQEQSKATGKGGKSSRSRRTVAELLEGGTRQREVREDVERKAKQRQQKALAAKRKKALDALAAREPAAWIELETLIEQSRYDEALEKALDLRELATREQHQGEFASKFEALRKRQIRKRGFIDRWKHATGSRPW